MKIFFSDFATINVLCQNNKGMLILKTNFCKVPIPFGGCPSQVLFRHWLVLGMSSFMSSLIHFCPWNFLVLPLLWPERDQESKQNPLSWPSSRLRLLVGFWKVYRRATFDPHQVLCLSLEMWTLICMCIALFPQENLSNTNTINTEFNIITFARKNGMLLTC